MSLVKDDVLFYGLNWLIDNIPDFHPIKQDILTMCKKKANIHPDFLIGKLKKLNNELVEMLGAEEYFRILFEFFIELKDDVAEEGIVCNFHTLDLQNFEIKKGWMKEKNRTILLQHISKHVKC